MKQQSFYIDQPSVADNNLITAGSAGALLWAKQIIERFGVFETSTPEAWYDFFRAGKPEHFLRLCKPCRPVLLIDNYWRIPVYLIYKINMGLQM